MAAGWWVLIGIGALLVLLAIYDVLQRRHSILRVFPVVGHLRFILEAFGPELRQYIVTSNDDERPFSRNARRWIYASSKHQNSSFAFGTDAEFERTPGYVIISPAAFPAPPPPGGDPDDWPLQSAKVLGGPREREKAFRPASVVNISGMSFGALSARAVESLNAGAALAGCMQTTGEGGLTPYHLQGGDLVMQFGSGWFGARDSRGRLDLPRLVDLVHEHPIRAVELKLSQGAKPGVGGMLPGSKVTPEIAAIRGVEVGQPCESPPCNPEFGSADELLDVVERIADATGVPVGIKSAVGEVAFWNDLARLMEDGSRGVDFITIDGGEGGTGSGPLAFVDHVGLPYRLGQARALRAFAEAKSDGIIQVSTGGGTFASGTSVGDEAFGAIVLAEAAHRLAEKYNVLVALHTDHCQPNKVDSFLQPLIEETRKRRGAGLNNLFQSHMLDASELPLADNLALSEKLHQTNEYLLGSM